MHANIVKAADLLNKLGESNDIIIAIVSREYSRNLPVQIVPKFKSLSLIQGED